MRKISKILLAVLMVFMAVPNLVFADVDKTMNPAFKDENFYRCVVDSYFLNQAMVTSDPIINLTDDDLKELTSLKCGSRYGTILDVSGLEKISNLVTLDLYNNPISEINIEKNIKLKHLNLGNNKLSEINLTKNTELESLDLYSDYLKEINLSKNVELKDLNLGGGIKKLDLKNNKHLVKLNINWLQLEELDLNQNVELESLEMSYTKVAKLDLSNNKKLVHANLNGNSFSYLNLSQNALLESLGMHDTKLSLGTNYVALGKTSSLDNIKFPKDFKLWKISYTTGDNTIATIENGVAKGIKLGTTKVSAKIVDKIYDQSDINAEGTIVVYNVLSNTYKIENNSINVGKEKDEKTILSNIKIEGTDKLSKEIKDSKILIKDGEKVVATFDMIVEKEEVKDVANPKTGDINIVFVMLGLVSFAGLALVANKKVRKIKNN